MAIERESVFRHSLGKITDLVLGKRLSDQQDSSSFVDVVFDRQEVIHRYYKNGVIEYRLVKKEGGELASDKEVERHLKSIPNSGCSIGDVFGGSMNTP